MAWLIVDDRDGTAAHHIGALPTAVPLAAQTLPGPVIRADADKVTRAVEFLEARGVSCFVLRSDRLNALRMRRRRASAARVDGNVAIVDTADGSIELSAGTVAAAFLVEEPGDAAWCVVLRGSGATVFVLKSALADAALFARVGQVLGRALGHAVDESLRAHGHGRASALGLEVFDLVDIAAAFDRGELIQASRDERPSALATESTAVAPATVGLPLGDDDGVAKHKKCQSCNQSVDLQDCYLILSQPTCDACAKTYVDDFASRAAKLGAIFAASLFGFLVLAVLFGPIGRAVGAVGVLFAFYTVMTTGAQYDVDVERKRGRERSLVRAGGAFKKWGDLDGTWWGRWLVRRGALIVIVVGLWFLPIPNLLSMLRAPAPSPAVARPKIPTHVLEVAGAPVARLGLQVRFVELQAQDGRFVVSLQRGDQKRQRAYSLDELKQGVDGFGVRFFAVDATVPPATPSLTIAFDADVPPGAR